jgi:sugar O-acyltransferase (sialic acid O-acetyltransferase NeuD family)
MIPMVMIGSGGHALSCLDVIKTTNKFNVIGYVDSVAIKGPWQGIPYLGTDADLPFIVRDCPNFFLGIGQIRDARLRTSISEKLKNLNACFPVVISPYSYVAMGASISEGTIVMNGSYLGPGSKVGAFGILNTKSIIEHGVELDAFVHVSTAAVINGDVKVGAETFIGSNSVLCHNITIPKKSFIQAGTFIGRKHEW